MKAKVKFDPKSIQQFFLNHVEKIVVAAVAGLFGLFAYQAFTLPSYESKPDTLQGLATQATNTISAGPKDGETGPATVCKIEPFGKEIEVFKKPLRPLDFDLQVPLVLSPIAPRRPRGMPEVLPVEQLRATAGRGAMEVGNVVQGMRWVALTGLIPLKSQTAKYRDTFTGAAVESPTRDVPDYRGFFVQRAEVIPGSSGEPEWEKVGELDKLQAFFSLKSSTELSETWGHLDPEVADPLTINPILCSPLPHWTDGTWGKEVVHEPTIPVAPLDAANPANGGEGQPIRVHGEGRPQTPLGGRDRRVVGEGGGKNGVPSHGMSPVGGGDDIDSLGGNTNPAAEGVKSKAEEITATLPDYLLLRFIDTDVQPGKHYRYRVFLVLANPNREDKEMHADVLEKPEFAKFAYIGQGAEKKDANNVRTAVQIDPAYAKWSAASPSVRIPEDSELLAGPIVGSKGSQEINAEVRVTKWIEKTGTKAFKEFSGRVRGTVLDFPDQVFKPPVPRASAAAASEEGPRGHRDQSAPRNNSESVNVDFTSNCILVDLFGGQPLSLKDKSLFVPGQVIIMDNTGNLVIHDVVTDVAEYEKFTAPPDVPQPIGGHQDSAPGAKDDSRPPRPRPPSGSNDFQFGNPRGKGGR